MPNSSPCGATLWRPPSADALAFERTLTSDDLIAYLPERLPAAGVPRVVVLDNASLHSSKVTKAARPGLAQLGIYLYYLPAYRPELNEIEPVFKQVKHHAISQRSHTSKAELRATVEQGFDSYGRKLRPNVIDNYGRLLRTSYAPVEAKRAFTSTAAAE